MATVCLPLLPPGATRWRQVAPGVSQVAKMHPANCRWPNNPGRQVLRSTPDMPSSTSDVLRSPDDNQIVDRSRLDVTGHQMKARSRPDWVALTKHLPVCRRAVLIVPLDIIKMIEATETPNHSPTWTTIIPARTGYCRPRS
jgi:hypothetical protein